MIVEVRINCVVVVQEAKIKLAEDLENVGSQNVAGWHEALSKLTGEHAGANHDRALQPQGGGGKTEVAPGGGEQSTA